MSEPVIDIKACCAAAYDSDIVALVLGASYHPGGLTLTRRLAELTGLHAGQRLLDVASGPGTSAVLLAREYDVRVDGIDLADSLLARARDAAGLAGVSDRVSFCRSDAERLPFEDETFDAVWCECAFCTLPDKPAAAAEFARVLKPGGRVAISDVTVIPGGLPTELRDVAGWIACLADARSIQQYEGLLTDEGLDVSVVERHDDALARMIERIDARLRALRMASAMTGVDVDRALHLASQAADAVARGSVGYLLLVATKPIIGARNHRAHNGI